MSAGFPARIASDLKELFRPRVQARSPCLDVRRGGKMIGLAPVAGLVCNNEILDRIQRHASPGQGVIDLGRTKLARAVEAQTSLQLGEAGQHGTKRRTIDTEQVLLEPSLHESVNRRDAHRPFSIEQRTQQPVEPNKGTRHTRTKSDRVLKPSLVGELAPLD